MLPRSTSSILWRRGQPSRLNPINCRGRVFIDKENEIIAISFQKDFSVLGKLRTVSYLILIPLFPRMNQAASSRSQIWKVFDHHDRYVETRHLCSLVYPSTSDWSFTSRSFPRSRIFRFSRTTRGDLPRKTLINGTGRWTPTESKLRDLTVRTLGVFFLNLYQAHKTPYFILRSPEIPRHCSWLTDHCWVPKGVNLPRVWSIFSMHHIFRYQIAPRRIHLCRGRISTSSLHNNAITLLDTSLSKHQLPTTSCTLAKMADDSAKSTTTDKVARCRDDQTSSFYKESSGHGSKLTRLVGSGGRCAVSSLVMMKNPIPFTRISSRARLSFSKGPPEPRWRKRMAIFHFQRKNLAALRFTTSGSTQAKWTIWHRKHTATGKRDLSCTFLETPCWTSIFAMHSSIQWPKESRSRNVCPWTIRLSTLFSTIRWRRTYFKNCWWTCGHILAIHRPVGINTGLRRFRQPFSIWIPMEGVADTLIEAGKIPRSRASMNKGSLSIPRT